MGLILRLLSGSGGMWILVGGLAAAAAAGGVIGYGGRGVIDAPKIIGAQLGQANAEKAAESCRADHETDRANGNAKVADELQRAATKLTGIIQDLENKRITRDAATAKFLVALSQLPQSTVCGGSEPERAYRYSVQPAHRPAVP